jgi:bifunctional aspartokinase / homoserine dehydrogenase 1
MNVLKFGGTSMGSPASIKNVVKIVKEKSESSRVLVVVSAMSGMTDELIRMAKMAENHDESYIQFYQQAEKRHKETASSLLNGNDIEKVFAGIDEIFRELGQSLRGVFLLSELPEITNNKIISTGEYLSAWLLFNLIQEIDIETRLIDSKEYIKGACDGKLVQVDYESSYGKIAKLKEFKSQVFVAPGFVASDSANKTITLGRGGSDFSASLYAVGLKAKNLEIWTDVNGMYSADPRMVTSAVPIEELSFNEAMELSHFGAKVIYTPTMHPLLQYKIDVLVKNTFEPEHIGTRITHQPVKGTKQIRGLSSINKISLVSLSGCSMVGITGISSRFFTAMARERLNVIMITQASSEHSICIALKDEDGAKAAETLGKEFSYEISVGMINKLTVENGFAIISLVGENMINTKGICGKAFSAIGRNGINIHAIAQGSSEISISFVVQENYCRKALNVLHEEFFLSSSKTINLYIAGLGNVGGKLVEIIRDQQNYFEEKIGARLIVKGISNSRKMMFNENGIDLVNWKELLPQGNVADIATFVHNIRQQNLRNSVFVDATASELISDYYEELLESHVNIVTCNKIASSSAFKRYKKLKGLARANNIRFLFESNVGAGLPIINTINNMLASGDEIISIEGVLSGSVNFVMNEFYGGKTIRESVLLAMKAGYTEPDPRVDLSGVDVARKLLILSREAGYQLEMEDIQIDKVLPQLCFDAAGIEDFLEKLFQIEKDMAEMLAKAKQKGCKLRYIACYNEQKASVSLQEVNPESPFFHIDGKDNLVILKTKWYFNQPLVIKGAGAGAEVTASGIMADIIQAVHAAQAN